MFIVLFVCSGNSCRSPMAEGILKKMVADSLPNEEIQVLSAGTLGIDGAPATDFAIKVTGDMGIDIRPHRSQGVSKALIEKSDLIIPMATHHKNDISQITSDAPSKTFLLKELAEAPDYDKYPDIEDPIGGDITVYRACFAEIWENLEQIIPQIKKLIEQK